MTNADKIRQMTDEDLAEVIMCPYDSTEDICSTQTGCIACCLEWLHETCDGE